MKDLIFGLVVVIAMIILFIVTVFGVMPYASQKGDRNEIPKVGAAQPLQPIS